MGRGILNVGGTVFRTVSWARLNKGKRASWSLKASVHNYSALDCTCDQQLWVPMFWLPNQKLFFFVGGGNWNWNLGQYIIIHQGSLLHKSSLVKLLKSSLGSFEFIIHPTVLLHLKANLFHRVDTCFLTCFHRILWGQIYCFVVWFKLFLVGPSASNLTPLSLKLLF